MKGKTSRLAGLAGSSSVTGCLATIVVLCVCVWVVGGCKSSSSVGDSQSRQTEPASSTSFVRPGPVRQADNSACLDCHLDFADEMIVSVHLKQGFGCTACHGESVAHGEDEANVTKPDVLFGRTQITPFCELCHESHKSDEKYNEFMQEWRGRRRPSGVMLLDDATCTDCHGRHVLIGE